MSRWIELLATTPSGKMQFVCRFCGRTTPAPEPTCPGTPVLSTGGSDVHPQANISCKDLEAAYCMNVRADILWNNIPRTGTLVERILTADTLEEMICLVREDRQRLFCYISAQFALHKSGLAHIVQSELRTK